jgi:hypothetical protein
MVFTGSGDVGDNIAIRGTVDKTGTIVKSAYVLDGSTTARYQTDEDTGTLEKR